MKQDGVAMKQDMNQAVITTYPAPPRPCFMQQTTDGHTYISIFDREGRYTCPEETVLLNSEGQIEAHWINQP